MNDNEQPLQPVVQLRDGEYVCLIAFVRDYQMDCEIVADLASNEPLPAKLARQLAAELGPAVEYMSIPGRFQVLAVTAPAEEAA